MQSTHKPRDGAGRQLEKLLRRRRRFAGRRRGAEPLEVRRFSAVAREREPRPRGRRRLRSLTAEEAGTAGRRAAAHRGEVRSHAAAEDDVDGGRGGSGVVGVRETKAV